MKKVLKLTFKNSEGSTNVMTIANPQQDLSAETVKAAMQKIVDSKAFVEDGVELYSRFQKTVPSSPQAAMNATLSTRTANGIRISSIPRPVTRSRMTFPLSPSSARTEPWRTVSPPLSA